MTAWDPSKTNPDEHGSHEGRVQFLVLDGVARPLAERLIALEDRVTALEAGA